MAAVYKPSDALNFAKAMIKYMPLDDVNVQVPILDMAAKMLWMAAPWRWTLSNWGIGPLVAGSPTTTVSVPADFMYLESAYIWDAKKRVELEVVPHIPVLGTGAQGMPAEIAIQDTSAVVTPFYAIGTPSMPTIIGTYKQVHPTITSGNKDTAGQGLPPDEWFWVYCECVLYWAYKYGDYQQAGSAQVAPNGQIQYTGQLGVAMAAIQEMRAAEKLLVRPWTRRDEQGKG